MERWNRIRESRTHRWYKEVRGEGISGYLRKRWGERGGIGIRRKRGCIDCVGWRRKHGNICGRSVEDGREDGLVAGVGRVGVRGGGEGEMVVKGGREGEGEGAEGEGDSRKEE